MGTGMGGMMGASMGAVGHGVVGQAASGPVQSASAAAAASAPHSPRAATGPGLHSGLGAASVQHHQHHQGCDSVAGESGGAVTGGATEQPHQEGMSSRRLE